MLESLSRPRQECYPRDRGITVHEASLATVWIAAQQLDQ